MVLRESSGNMYEWVTHTANLIGGECPHNCSYCYVDSPRFGRPLIYTGAIRPIEKEFLVSYGSGKTIFVGSANDIWANAVPEALIERVLQHCRAYPDNTYLFQSKNPARFIQFLARMPPRTILATTIETDREYPGISLAPCPRERAHAMTLIRGAAAYRHPNTPIKLEVTVEPILQCNPKELAKLVMACEPDWVSVGADSQSHELPEPTAVDIQVLIDHLAAGGVQVKLKGNLSRLFRGNGDGRRPDEWPVPDSE